MTQKEKFNHVENLLFQYKKTKKKIITMEINLDDIVLKKCSSIGIGGTSVSIEYKSDMEKREEIKEIIKKRIDEYKKLVILAENLLEQIKDDKYYDIIKLRYLDNKKIVEIVEILGLGATTIKKQKVRLIEDLAKTIFPI